jgi:UV DNA damage endonuclease
MKIRFGYVATALGLWDASPSKTLTYTRFCKLNKHERMDLLKTITAKNLAHTKRILHYNLAHEIKLYRFSSALVPLATHPEVKWDFITPFRSEWKQLGELIKFGSMRPSFHPGQYTLFTSPRNGVTENAVFDMEYHYKMLEAMGIEQDAAINIHIGGAYGDKKSTLIRFHENLKTLPNHIKRIMTLENDDKTYNIRETLEACEKENIPMVLDYHHYIVNKDGLELEVYIDRIFKTWTERNLLPIVHLSSPKSKNELRAHNDFVALDFVLPFIKLARELNRDFDCMIEAKQKNLAMFRFIEELTSIRGIRRIDSSSIEW